MASTSTLRGRTSLLGPLQFYPRRGSVTVTGVPASPQTGLIEIEKENDLCPCDQDQDQELPNAQKFRGRISLLGPLQFYPRRGSVTATGVPTLPQRGRTEIEIENDRDQDPPKVQKGGVLEVGSAVPDFTLTCVDGKTHRLSDFRGRKVMLCFYRKSTCPACAYTISKLIGNYKKLAWASKLTVITVFRTDHDSLRKGLTDADAPIRNLAGISASGYPFLGLADPEGTAAAAFRVNKKELIAPHKLLRALSSGRGRRALRESLSHVSGEDTLLPSEFLIDEGGVLVDVLRARKRDESMALSRVNGFLLGGYDERRSPASSSSRNFRQSRGRGAGRRQTIL